MKIDIRIESKISTSSRARQVSAMFDAPVADKCRLEWHLDLPIEKADWNVGLVAGPSGSGKSTILRHVWGEMPPLKWGARSVVDDFAADLSMDRIAAVCGAVGFNTIPAWMRPYNVLSNGEKFRVDLARRLVELPDPVVVDEFSSVVDRQVAKIGAHAVQKFVRRNKRSFIAITCHYDVVDWLQPDWVLDMATRSWTRRSLQRRPDIECAVGRVSDAAWPLFRPFHYMSGALHRAARCFGLWADGRLAAFAAMLHMAHPRTKDIIACSRLVTLPDWQGLGLGLRLLERVASAYTAFGKRVRGYPAHPALVRQLDKSPLWRLEKRPGFAGSSTRTYGTSTLERPIGDRPCATFQYVGPVMPVRDAQRLIAA